MSGIRPGSHIDFFYYSDYEKESIHVLRSNVYDVMGKKMIIAQSSPSVLRSSIKKQIVVTYLVKQDDKPARFGFPATIDDLIYDYQISSGEKVAAILIVQEGGPRSFDARFHYRLKVPYSSDLMLSIRGEKVNLLDISLGGAMISGTTVSRFTLDERIKVTVDFDGQSHNLAAEVLRIWSPRPETGHKELQLAALRFLNPPAMFEDALGKKIFSIERQLLADGLLKSQ